MTPPAPRRLDAFGLQLSTLTPLLMADFEGTLEQVAQIGYRQVEFSALGFLGRPAPYVADLLARNNLEAPVGRISPKLPEGFGAMSRLQQMEAFRRLSGPDHLLDNVAYALDGAQRLGQKHLVLPALMPDRFQTQAQVSESIELLRRAGDLCAERGVQFGYHNHDWEFAPVAGAVPFDQMLADTDPAQVAFQLDVYWVTKAGADPYAYLKNHAARFPSVHLKDIDSGGDFADVGFGRIDFPRFVRESQAAGTQYYFVERDNPPAPMQTAQRAFDYLRQMTY